LAARCKREKKALRLFLLQRCLFFLPLSWANRAAADKFWNEEPLARNGGYSRDHRIIRWVFGH
jgi:hypothetical protein